jgi:hypothetical protein
MPKQWNDELDRKLLLLMIGTTGTYDWNAVAEHMGEGFTNESCRCVFALFIFSPLFMVLLHLLFLPLTPSPICYLTLFSPHLSSSSILPTPFYLLLGLSVQILLIT